MIMATMMELAQRMLTKRPTVARASERPNRLAARSPTRARDPRTEITRPKDVTVVEPGMLRVWVTGYFRGSELEKRLSEGRSGSVKSATSCQDLVVLDPCWPAFAGGFCGKIDVFGTRSLAPMSRRFNAWFTNPAASAVGGAFFRKCLRLASAAGFGRGSQLIRRLLPAQRAAILIFDDAGLEEILLLEVHGFGHA